MMPAGVHRAALGLGLGVALVTGGVGRSGPGDGSAAWTLTVKRPGVLVSEDGASWTRGRGAEAVAAPPAVRTGRSGRARLALGASRIELEPETVVQAIRLDERGAEVELRRGAVSVATRGLRVRLLVPDGRAAETSDGEFRLSLEPGDARVAVERGDVDLTEGERVRRVPAGHQSPATAAAPGEEGESA